MFHLILIVTKNSEKENLSVTTVSLSKLDKIKKRK